MNSPTRLFAGVMGVLVSSSAAFGVNPFAARVLEYRPAPGQFVNDANFSDPRAALGPPLGGGTSEPGNESIVTLGGFGGHIILGFDHTVMDDPMNAYGMDAIVYGNAHWVGGNPQRHWAESATIEISRDANGNGVADDPWHLVPGSHLPDPPSAWSQTWWDDDIEDLTYPPDDEFWIPVGFSGQWTTVGFELPGSPFTAVVVVNPIADGVTEGVWGYAEYSPTLVLGDTNADNVVDVPGASAEEFYTTPDDPRVVGMSPGAGGGDAFDIAWAVDPQTGEPAGLDGFDFIRLTTAIDVVSPTLGEKSAEIDAVADVSPDPFGDADMDGDVDLADAAELLVCFLGEPAEACAALDRQNDGAVDMDDVAPFVERLTGPR